MLATVAAIAMGAGTLDPVLAKECTSAAAWAVQQYGAKGLKEDQLAIGLAALDQKSHTFRYGSVAGDQPFYPASVVKLFYLAYAADSLAHGRVKSTPEFQRGVRDMIVDSVNDACAYVLETITGASSGPELPASDMRTWVQKREAVNRWYKAMGYEGVNACNRTWNEGPYGREREFLGKDFSNRNSLTPNACLRLMSEIGLGVALRGDLSEAESAKWCDWMKTFLSRRIPADAADADYQSKSFTGGVLPSGSRLWSKAGYTDTARHDVAYVRLPSGQDLVIVVFTKNNSGIEEIIPSVAKRLIESQGDFSTTDTR